MPVDILEPDGSSFFGVRHEDLPYSSERKASRFNGPPLSLKGEGALLLSALTGVVNTNRKATTALLKSGNLAKTYGDLKEKPANLLQEYRVYGSDLDSAAKRLGTTCSGDGIFFPESSFYEGRGVRRGSQGPADRSPRPTFASLPHTPRRMSLGQSAQLSDRRRSTVEGFSFRSPRPPRSPRRGPPKDEACDTSDIPINTFFVESDDELLNETVSALDLEKQKMEDPMQRNKLALDDYMGQLKETTNRLGLRANMLHELTTEDIESSYSTVPPPPKARMLSVTGPVLEFEEEPEEPEKPTVGQHVKQARRLAGSMNVHQQSNGLRDIHRWLQHLGHIAQEEDFVDVGGARFKPKDMEFGEGDWRLPSSPAMALQLAQEDLRNRLGSLYAERQEVLNRQAELMAATKLASRDGEAEEARLREFLRRMHMLEDEYHLLGGKLAENLSEAENLDRRHQRLRKDVHDTDQHGATMKSSEKWPSVADEDQRAEAHVHADAKHKAGRKKTSKLEDPGLEEPGTAVLESKKKVHRRRSSQDQDRDHGADGSSTASESLGSASVSALAATVPSKASPAGGGLVKATPSPEPEPTSIDELEGYALDTGTEDEIDKQDASLSESVEKLLENSDEEREEAVEHDGPNFADIEIKKRKPRRKKTRDQDETVASGGEDEKETRRRRPGKRQAEGEASGSFDYSNVSSMYESLSTQDAKGKYIRDDKKRSGTSRRSALEWKNLLESGQCKHRSCQTDPSITERQKKSRGSLFDAAGRRDSDALSQMDNKELRREVVRLKQRLRFWRARNWADQHKTQPAATVPASLGPQYMIDDSSHVMYHSSSETNDSRGAGGTTPMANPSSLRGRDSVSVSKSPVPDQESVIHEENLAAGLLPDSAPSFVVFGTSPNHTPRDSRAGSLVPARGSRAGSMVVPNRSRVNSKGSISIRRNSPGVEALRLQATAVRPNSL